MEKYTRIRGTLKEATVLISNARNSLTNVSFSMPGGDTEQALLNETVPPWVTEIVVDKNMPKFNKIPFFLQPHARFVDFAGFTYPRS